MEVPMRRIMSACALALVLAVPAFAAKVDTGKLQLPDDLTQAQAEQVMAGALVKAVEQGVPMNIAIVDAGGEVVDVIVEHPVYGQLTGLLGVRSRYDVAEFVRRVEEHGARPLSALTGGIHLHTVRCPDEKTFRRVRKSLEAENFLLNM